MSIEGEKGPSQPRPWNLSAVVSYILMGAGTLGMVGSEGLPPKYLGETVSFPLFEVSEGKFFTPEFTEFQLYSMLTFATGFTIAWLGGWFKK